MEKQVSFTKYEREILPLLRDNLNRAESTEDVKKFFSYTSKELLDLVFAENGTETYNDDITFEPEKKPFYKIDKRLSSLEIFAPTWRNSDLSNILANLAQTAKNRYTRLEKHLDKTEAKIRR